MYIPEKYKGNDLQEALRFMERFSFATMVSNGAPFPQATHLPFVVKQIGEQIVLQSHLAKANAHSESLNNENHLIIFQQPHAYISPKLYERKPSVPTWDYIAVHAKGKARIINDASELMALIEGSIAKFDPNFMQEMDRLPKDYLNALLEELVAFEIVVEELDFKKKMSQDRSRNERTQIIEHLENDTVGNSRDLATYMKKEN